MVAFGFRDSADAIHKIECGFEIRKHEAFRDVMFFDDVPIRKLRGQSSEFGTA